MKATIYYRLTWYTRVTKYTSRRYTRVFETEDASKKKALSVMKNPKTEDASLWEVERTVKDGRDMNCILRRFDYSPDGISEILKF